MLKVAEERPPRVFTGSVSDVGVPGAAPGEPSVGQLICDARKRRGVSAEDAVREAKIPLHYLRMIESDNYGAISDQLYLMPFLRRYATFLGLDSEDVASRFVREVQRAENSAPKLMGEPIPMIEHRSRAASWRNRAAAIVIAFVAAMVAILIWRHVTASHRLAHSAASEAPVSARSAAAPAAHTHAAASGAAPAPAARSAASNSEPTLPEN
jgi:cytoskeleton protein RodZ